MLLRKISTIGSGLVVAGYLTFYFITGKGCLLLGCAIYSTEVLASILTTFSFFFFFSLLLSRARKEVFLAWFWASIVLYIPISLISSFNTPVTGGYGIALGQSPDLTALFYGFCYTILSIIVITIAHFYYKKQ